MQNLLFRLKILRKMYPLTYIDRIIEENSKNTNCTLY